MSLSRFFRRRKKVSSHIQSSCPLLQLPMELLDHIYGYLDITDVLLLSRTCHSFRRLVIQNRNLRVEAFQNADRDQYRRLSRKEQCYKFLDEQSKGGNGRTGLSICGSCLAPHPDDWFTVEELSKGPFERICRPRTTPIEVCEHLKLYYHEIEEFKATGKRSMYLCEEHDDPPCTELPARIDLVRDVASHSAVDQKHSPGKTILTYSIHYKFLKVTEDCGVNWHLCAHVSLRTVARRLLEDSDSTYGERLACQLCFLRFKRFGGQKDSLLVKRDLGRGSNVSDACWLTAIEFQPRLEQTVNHGHCTTGRKARRLHVVCGC